MKLQVDKKDAIQTVNNPNKKNEGIGVIKYLNVRSYGYTMLLIISLIFLSFRSIYAQDVSEVNGLLADMEKSNDSFVKSEADHIRNLINNLSPVVYVDDKISENGNSLPECAFVDSKWISELNNGNSLYANVELLVIKYNNPRDLDNSIELNQLNQFANLKYVYFIFEFNIGIDTVKKLIIPKDDIRFFYKVSIPA